MADGCLKISADKRVLIPVAAASICRLRLLSAHRTVIINADRLLAPHSPLSVNKHQNLHVKIFFPILWHCQLICQHCCLTGHGSKFSNLEMQFSVRRGHISCCLDSCPYPYHTFQFFLFLCHQCRHCHILQIVKFLKLNKFNMLFCSKTTALIAQW